MRWSAVHADENQWGLSVLADMAHAYEFDEDDEALDILGIPHPRLEEGGAEGGDGGGERSARLETAGPYCPGIGVGAAASPPLAPLSLSTDDAQPSAAPCADAAGADASRRRGLRAFFPPAAAALAAVSGAAASAARAVRRRGGLETETKGGEEEVEGRVDAQGARGGAIGVSDGRAALGAGGESLSSAGSSPALSASPGSFPPLPSSASFASVVTPSQLLSLLRSTAAAGSAQVISTTVTFPLDTLKALVQCGVRVSPVEAAATAAAAAAAAAETAAETAAASTKGGGGRKGGEGGGGGVRGVGSGGRQKDGIKGVVRAPAPGPLPSSSASVSPPSSPSSLLSSGSRLRSLSGVAAPSAPSFSTVGASSPPPRVVSSSAPLSSAPASSSPSAAVYRRLSLREAFARVFLDPSRAFEGLGAALPRSFLVGTIRVAAFPGIRAAYVDAARAWRARQDEAGRTEGMVERAGSLETAGASPEAPWRPSDGPGTVAPHRAVSGTSAPAGLQSGALAPSAGSQSGALASSAGSQSGALAPSAGSVPSGAVSSSVSLSSASPPPMWASVAAGATTGFAAGICLHPLEVAKTISQVGGAPTAATASKRPSLPSSSSASSSASSFRVLVGLVCEGGVSRLFRGCLPSALRLSVLTALQLSLYAQAKDAITSALGWDAASSAARLPAALAAGLAAVGVSAPLDMVKMRAMTDQPSVRAAVRTIWREDGLRGFFRGVGPTALWFVPNSTIMLSCVDLFATILGGEQI